MSVEERVSVIQQQLVPILEENQALLDERDVLMARVAELEELVEPSSKIVWEVLPAKLNVRTEPRADSAYVATLVAGDTIVELERRSVSGGPAGQPGSDLWVRHLQGWSAAIYRGQTYMSVLVEPDELAPAETLEGSTDYIVGVGTAEPASWQLAEDSYTAIQEANLTGIKLAVPGVTQDIFNRLRQINPDLFIMARLFGSGDVLSSPQWFVNHVGNDLALAYANGVRYFEVHNEPNLEDEGLGKYWADGGQFAQWFIAVTDLLRERCPDAKWLFPGLSPVANFHSFIRAAGSAVARADALGVHVYWDNVNSTWQTARDALTTFCKDHPEKPVFCTEFSRRESFDYAAKGREYRDLVTATYPINLEGLFGFVLGRKGMEGWNKEVWAGTEIPRIIGERER